MAEKGGWGDTPRIVPDPIYHSAAPSASLILFPDIRSAFKLQDCEGADSWASKDDHHWLNLSFSPVTTGLFAPDMTTSHAQCLLLETNS